MHLQLNMTIEKRLEVRLRIHPAYCPSYYSGHKWRHVEK